MTPDNVVREWGEHDPSRYWILDPDGSPVPVSCLEWAEWFETADRVLARDDVPGSVVSTVFHGLDHSWTGPPPVFWETMVFSDGCDDAETRRYSSRDAALAGHGEIVARWRGNR